MKFERVVCEICEWSGQADKQTGKHTDTLITVLRTHTGGEAIKTGWNISTSISF